MRNAVTGRKPEALSEVPESLKDTIKEAARRASGKVAEALSNGQADEVIPLPANLRA